MPLRHNARRVPAAAGARFFSRCSSAASARLDGARRSGRPLPEHLPDLVGDRKDRELGVALGQMPCRDGIGIEPPGKHARGAVLFHALDGRRGIVGPMRAARPVASRRITALGLKCFIAARSCHALASAGKSGPITRFCVACPAGEVFVAAGGTARFARRAAQLVRSTALAARST